VRVSKVGAWLPIFALFACAALMACKKKVTREECDALVDRFAYLVVTERAKDAKPDVIRAVQARERVEARADDAFRNCTSEIAREDYACAMRADTSDGIIQCLE
jgi:hypothetical protein